MHTAISTYPFDAYNGRTLIFDSDEVVHRKRRAFVRGAGYTNAAEQESVIRFPLLHARRTEKEIKVNSIILLERVAFNEGQDFKSQKQ